MPVQLERKPTAHMKEIQIIFLRDSQRFLGDGLENSIYLQKVSISFCSHRIPRKWF